MIIASSTKIFEAYRKYESLLFAVDNTGLLKVYIHGIWKDKKDNELIFADRYPGLEVMEFIKTSHYNTFKIDSMYVKVDGVILEVVEYLDRISENSILITYD